MNGLVEIAYNKSEWKSRFTKVKTRMEKAEQLLEAIECLQQRRKHNIESAALFSSFSLAAIYKKRAAAQLRAIAKIREAFNLIIMEIQL